MTEWLTALSDEELFGKFLPFHVIEGCKSYQLREKLYCVSVSVFVPPSYFLTRPSGRNQIWHTYSNRYGTDSNVNQLAPRMYGWREGDMKKTGSGEMDIYRERGRERGG